jgi:hypothetical protein
MSRAAVFLLWQFTNLDNRNPIARETGADIVRKLASPDFAV